MADFYNSFTKCADCGMTDKVEDMYLADDRIICVVCMIISCDVVTSMTDVEMEALEQAPTLYEE